MQYCYSMMTLTMIQPASKWTHLAILRRCSCLLRAAISVSIQVRLIFCRSFLIMLLQFVLDQPGSLLHPVTSQYNTCCGACWWTIHITCPSQWSLLSLSMLSVRCCPVIALTSSFVIVFSRKCLLCSLSHYRRWPTDKHTTSYTAHREILTNFYNH